MLYFMVHFSHCLEFTIKQNNTRLVAVIWKAVLVSSYVSALIIMTLGGIDFRHIKSLILQWILHCFSWIKSQNPSFSIQGKLQYMYFNTFGPNFSLLILVLKWLTKFRVVTRRRGAAFVKILAVSCPKICSATGLREATNVKTRCSRTSSAIWCYTFAKFLLLGSQTITICKGLLNRSFAQRNYYI